MAHIFKYCVLRFRPDLRRGESVNIGVVLFGGDHVDVHLSDSFGKAQALVPGLSFESLSTLETRINDVVRGMDTAESKHAAIQRFGPITASALGVIELGHDTDYEQVVARLLIDFVYPPRTLIKPRNKPGQLKKTVRNLFSHAGMLGKKSAEIHDHKVICEFPIAESENLYADFAFKNGVYRFAQVIDMGLAHSNPSAKFKDCCEKAVTLDKAKHEFGLDSERVVLFSAPDRHSPTVDAALNLLADYSSIMLNADNADDMSRFAHTFVSRDLATLGLQHPALP